MNMRAGRKFEWFSGDSRQ